eukprot:TRINITY_DN14723_c0_g1_i1.p1 TRINITY_DN14723_c0_g1~~TRINITY_DN14723_c0_g1_i1.p1  ORF type:complete len:159 (-),score=14.45 TRINITY_DN14723_c0_g1_i1:220-696(-)
MLRILESLRSRGAFREIAKRWQSASSDFVVPDGFKVVPIRGGFDQLSGTMYAKPVGDHFRYGYHVTERHTNHNGGIHGGFLMLMTDCVLGLSVIHKCGTARVVTVSLNINFLAGAKPGDWLEGEAEIARQTKTLSFPRGTIYRGSEPILTATGIWKIA